MVQVMKEAEPFFFEGNETAVLVVHGFTGSTQSVNYLGAELNRRFGFTVSGPRLSGHGTSPDDMETTGYRDWVSSAEDAMHQLAQSHERVFITGLSMGGTLTLNLAARFPDIVSGIAPINGVVGIMDGALAELLMARDVPKRIPGIGSDIKAEGVSELAYEEVPVACIRELYILVAATGDLLHRVTCPTLAVHSREDHVVMPENGYRIIERVNTSDVRLLWLNNSFHVATLDNDKDLLVEKIGSFCSYLS